MNFRKSQTTRPLKSNDLEDFMIWMGTIPRSPLFNWTDTHLLESFHKDICWGLWREDKLLSLVCFLNPSEPLEILWLATRPDYEGQGGMKILLQECLFNTSRRPTEVHLEVHEKNQVAIGLYHSLGFREQGRRKNYYKDGASALLMGLKIQ